ICFETGPLAAAQSPAVLSSGHQRRLRSHSLQRRNARSRPCHGRSKRLHIRRECCAQHFHRHFRSSCRCNSCRNNSHRGRHIGNHSRTTHNHRHSFHTHIRSRGRRADSNIQNIRRV